MGLETELATVNVELTSEQIEKRVHELGAEITSHYAGEQTDGELLVLGTLKGSFMFMSDLVRQILRPHKVEFIIAASYGDGTASSGQVRLLYDPPVALERRHVLLIEDIIDTGATLNRLVRLLQTRDPESLEICTLLHKRHATPLKLDAKFVGFDAPDRFLVGYGLDYAERYRHLPFVGSLKGE